MAQERSVVICGLPESGKTTFLAALWHLVTARDIDTQLVFDSLREGDQTYLNAIVRQWRDAKIQARTSGQPTLVSMNLRDRSKAKLRLTFPDLSGESYRRMWEERDCDPEVASILQGRTGLLVFIHADRIERQQLVVDVVEWMRRLELPMEREKPIKWHPRFAPTAVQVVELLQLLLTPPLGVGPERIAIVLSAWDKVEAEGLTPTAFLTERMPLLGQYLQHGPLADRWRVFGVSAQGGDYEPSKDSKKPWKREDVERARAYDKPSERITLTTDDGQSRDLTEPIVWLMG
jgi:Double-GTPase 1